MRRRIAAYLFPPTFLAKQAELVRKALAGLRDASRVGMAKAIEVVLVSLGQSRTSGPSQRSPPRQPSQH